MVRRSPDRQSDPCDDQATDWTCGLLPRRIMMGLLMTTTQTQLRLARRMSRLGTETAFEVLVRAPGLERQGKNIIHLEIGEPDMDTPANVVEAGVQALRKGYTHYGPAAGLPELREAVAAEVSSSRGIRVSPDEVVIVPGD